MERLPEQHEQDIPKPEELENLANRPESRNPENRQDQAEQAEDARRRIERHKEPEPASRPENKPQVTRHAVSRIDLEANYKETMTSVQRHLPAVSRAFSSFIHHPAVESVSDTAAKTVFRPSVTAGATLTALIVGGGMYFIARHYGYALSSSVFVFTLLVGAVLGAAIELVAWVISRPRR